MKERAGIFALTALAVVTILFALSRHQSVLRHEESARREKERGAAREKGLSDELSALKAKLGETEKQAQAAAQKVAELAQEIEKAKAAPPPPKPPEAAPLAEKLEALGKDLAAKDQNVLEILSQMQGKVDEAAAALSELKKEISTPGAGLLARLDEVSHLKEIGPEMAQQLLELEARLAAQEKILQDGLSSLRSELEGLHKKVGETSSSPSPSAIGGTSPLPAVPPPPTVVETTIQAASGNMVVLGAGKKSNIVVGHVFHVTRDGKPIGRVQVIKVYEDLSGAKVLDAVSGQSPQKGDQASTEDGNQKTPPPKAAQATEPGVKPPVPPPPPSAVAPTTPAPAPTTQPPPAPKAQPSEPAPKTQAAAQPAPPPTPPAPAAPPKPAPKASEGTAKPAEAAPSPKDAGGSAPAPAQASPPPPPPPPPSSPAPPAPGK